MSWLGSTLPVSGVLDPLWECSEGSREAGASPAGDGKASIRNLSKGYRQRVGIAAALLGSPKVIILDEPTGLDPAQMIEIRNLIHDLGETHTVILSSHILSEVQTICDRVLIIAHGKVAAQGTPEELAAQLAARRHDCRHGTWHPKNRFWPLPPRWRA